jgi:serpin B
MKTAFDKPHGSANFDRVAPRKPDDYLYISEVFHKTFIEVDEKGTEAAAATAVVMMAGSAFHPNPPQPIEVRVDRPFLFAIQHRDSGACLFLGRVTTRDKGGAELSMVVLTVTFVGNFDMRTAEPIK